MSFDSSKPRKICFCAGNHILFQQNRLPFFLITHEQNRPQETDLEDDTTYPLQVSPRRPSRQCGSISTYSSSYDQSGRFGGHESLIFMLEIRNTRLRPSVAAISMGTDSILTFCHVADSPNPSNGEQSQYPKFRCRHR
jgi:hypothetical protein